MKKQLKPLIYTAVLLLSGCQEFLEPHSQSEFVPSNIQALNELLTGEVYMGPQDAGMFSILGLFDDDITSRPLNYNQDEEAITEQVKYAFTWSREMYDYAGDYNLYGPMYQRIVGCNSVLDLLEDVSGEENEKNQVKAQALTMRAFYYFHLVNLYGQPYAYNKTAPGVPLKTTSALSGSSLPRNTVEEVYRQILKDLTEAEELFGSLPAGSQWQPDGRASLPMVQLLLSRMYLYMTDWEQAVKYGKKVIDQPQFSILDLRSRAVPTYNVMNYKPYYLYSNPEVIFVYGREADAINMAQKSHIRLQTEQGTRRGFLCVVSESLLNTFEENDLRKVHYLVPENAQTVATTNYFRPYGKYESDLQFSFSTGLDGQWGAALKVTEAYLNAAEGAARLYLESNNTAYRTEALQWMNQLRRFRFADENYEEQEPASAADLLSLVQNERRRELCFEHHRWFDLRRYGMERLTHVWNPTSSIREEYTLEKNDPGFTLLIPKEAIALNPALVQNPVRGK